MRTTQTTIDLSDYNNIIEGHDELRQKLVPASPTVMPEEFARSTMLALVAQQEILSFVLDENDPNYKTKLSAKAALASAQISAQQRADETSLRSKIIKSYYQEIQEAIKEYRKLHSIFK